ncbi:hypothetical protein CBOM_07460 [Ceraceosorus bombacis]|uniref:Uncharacterized protein n=1 Tax=Ceraceosorus bombacis TaxID=401625 RepID=A0A0P1BD02_9BASI|nr:hypothetical protein CBOM_07460 [Ceraceosorus bombacis]
MVVQVDSVEVPNARAIMTPLPCTIVNVVGSCPMWGLQKHKRQSSRGGSCPNEKTASWKEIACPGTFPTAKDRWWKKLLMSISPPQLQCGPLTVSGRCSAATELRKGTRRARRLPHMGTSTAHAQPSICFVDDERRRRTCAKHGSIDFATLVCVSDEVAPASEQHFDASRRHPRVAR